MDVDVDGMLQHHVQAQVERIMMQLRDLEDMRDVLDDEKEHEMIYQKSQQQLVQFQAMLRQVDAGQLSVLNATEHGQLEIQAAIRKAFSTPQVIEMFASKQPEQLRERLASATCRSEIVEILVALQKLGQTLLPNELELLQQNQHAFEQVSNQVDEAKLVHLLSLNAR